MPKTDTWPGCVAMDSLMSIDSTGSCDSVISMNSGFSDDSLEYLSAEEKACLMFLEETIESLEVEEDSGLSNDEPETRRLAREVPHLSTMKAQSAPQGESNLKRGNSGRDQKSQYSSGVPTPLPQAKAAASPPATNTHCQDKSPQPPSQTQGTKPSVPDILPAARSATQRKEPSSVAVADLTQPAVDVCDGPPKRSHGDPTRPHQGPLTASSDGGTALIPPPSDFMDEPGSQPQPAPPVLAARAPLADCQPEGQRAEASAQKDPPCELETHEAPSKPTVEPPVKVSVPPPPLEVPRSPSSDSVELKSPPAVAPKPKKLPTNIVLKSHKASLAGGSDGGAHTCSSATDHVHMDPQKVRMEALIKLGLVKADQTDSNIHPGPVPSPKSKRTGTAAPSSHSSRAASHTKTPAPANAPVKGPAVNPAPAATSSQPAALRKEGFVVPPALFSDPAASLPTHTDCPDSFIEVKAQVDTPSRGPLTASKLPTPPLGIKSATLERSGMGLGSDIASQGSSKASPPDGRPGQLRNSRPRPASLGSGKDFAGIQGVMPQPGYATAASSSREQGSGKTLPAPQAQHTPAGGVSAQKLPRSHGVSVLICPSGNSEEERRKALTRLGLIKN
ncbi:specifically androgen-regulated gene protein-like [Aplochiton taeniatus]